MREVYAPLRPSAQMLAQWRGVFGEDSDAERLAGQVSLAEQKTRTLASAFLRTNSPLIDLSDHAIRLRVGREYPQLLASFDVPHLDETDLRSRDRAFTQALTRALFDDGASGVIYPSNIDDGRCFALFEGRYALAATPGRNARRPMHAEAELLRGVCEGLGLTLAD